VPPDTEKHTTLIFLCVANSARSQMAEGLARASAPTKWRVFSAGSKPTLVHPLAIEVLQEIDIDISKARSKGLDAVPIDDADFIVTLCEDQVCPTVPQGTEHLDWALQDPAGVGDQIRFQLDAFRETRDEIRQRLDSFWEDKATSAA
jgi:protein-tyrosine-phosphatase